MSQPALFDLPAPAALVFLIQCPRCGKMLAAVPVDDAVNPWNAATQWGYLAQQQHNLTDHTEGLTP